MNPVISLLNNHDVEIRQKTLPGSIPRSDIANLLDAIARTIEKDVDYALGIPFDSMVSSMTGKQLTANDKYFVSQVGSVPGGGCILTLKGDGSHSPDLSNFLVVSGSYSNTSGVVNQLIFYYDGANYCVSIIQLPVGALLNNTAGSSGPDTTPPVVASIAVLNGNPSQVVITYNEALKTTAIPAASDFVITAGGSPATINSVAVSSNTVLLNLASAIIAGSSNFIQYTPGTNKIQDLAGNLAAAIPVNTLITNNVGTGGGTATQLNAPTGFTAGTPTATTVPLTWTDTNTSPNESSFEYQQSSNGGTTWVAASPGTASANATGATAGGLTGSTAYQFRVRAVGDGTTTTTSAWSNIVSATTLAGVTYLTWSAINSQLQQYNTNKGIQKLSTSANGWGAVAYSNQTFADGNSMVVKLDASTAVHRILSLNPTAANQGDSAPGWKWGMYLKGDGTVDIYENGVTATGGASITTWAATNYFRIRVSGTSVIYEKSTDGATWTTIATSAQAFSGTPIGCVEVYNPSAGFEEVSKS